MFLTIGADPEVFLRDKVTKDFISAHGLFPGTKQEPFKIDRGAVQVDGMALEFNIQPAKTVEEFDGNMTTVLTQLDEMLKKVSNDELEMVFEPVARFDPTYFSFQPFESKILGCEPDFDEFGNEKTPPEGMQDLPFRTAAGHVHIGFREGGDPKEHDHFENCKLISKTFKTVKGYVPLTSHEQERCRYYGGPGSFRPKSYGIELRSPSNKWVQTKTGREEMFKITYKTMMDIGNKEDMSR